MGLIMISSSGNRFTHLGAYGKRCNDPVTVKYLDSLRFHYVWTQLYLLYYSKKYNIILLTRLRVIQVIFLWLSWRLRRQILRLFEVSENLFISRMNLVICRTRCTSVCQSRLSIVSLSNLVKKNKLPFQNQLVGHE